MSSLALCSRPGNMLTVLSDTWFFSEHDDYSGRLPTCPCAGASVPSFKQQGHTKKLLYISCFHVAQVEKQHREAAFMTRTTQENELQSIR